MSELSKKDVEILNLKAARMSTASIAIMVGLSEAKVYNRLNALRVFSSGDALERLAAPSLFSLQGWARFGDEGLTLLMGALLRAANEVAPASPPPVIRVAPPEDGHIEELYVGGVQYVPSRPASRQVERPKPVAPAPLRPVREAAKPLPVAASVPPPPVARRSSPGAVRLKPVSPRVAAWAGHFRRARWPLAEVAHLFDVAEDDLALALGEAA